MEYQTESPETKSKVIIKPMPMNAKQLKGAYEIVSRKEKNKSSKAGEVLAPDRVVKSPEQKIKLGLREVPE